MLLKSTDSIVLSMCQLACLRSIVRKSTLEACFYQVTSGPPWHHSLLLALPTSLGPTCLKRKLALHLLVGTLAPVQLVCCNLQPTFRYGSPVASMALRCPSRPLLCSPHKPPDCNKLSLQVPHFYISLQETSLWPPPLINCSSPKPSTRVQ